MPFHRKNDIVKFRNTRSFFVKKNGNLVFSSNKDIKLFDGNLNQLDSIDNTSASSIKELATDSIIYQVNNGDDICITDFRNRKVINGRFFLSSLVEYKDFFLILGKKENGTETFTFRCSLNTLEIIYSQTSYNFYPNLILDENSYLFYGGRFIKRCNLSDGEDQWTLDISHKGAYTPLLRKKELGSVRRVFLFSNILIAEITGIFLLGVDSLTGLVLWEKHFDSKFFFTSSRDSDRICAFSYGTYFEIDIETGEILRKKSLELELKARDCSPASHTVPAVNEKYIAIAPGFKPKVLLIDRETLEIVQELDLKGSYVNNSEILQFHDNRLYILDAHNNLHIFEDE